MEFADGGDLQSKIQAAKLKGKFFAEAEIWSIFYQMVIGLKKLHDMQIVHRDIKCANVFLNKDGQVKLGDLNVSKVAKGDNLKTQTGTPYYASPEVWQDKPYDHRSDIWSLGCVAYELITLNPPFQAKDMHGLYKKVIRGVYPRLPLTFTSQLSQSIQACLQVNPKNRPLTQQILDMNVTVCDAAETK